MKDRNKNTYIKSGLTLLMIVGFLLISQNHAHARFIKKLVMEPLVNPKDWKNSFEPGTALTLMLMNSLEETGQFQMIHSAKSTTKKKVSPLIIKPDVVKDKKPDIVNEEKIDPVNFIEQTSILKLPTGQYLIRGHIFLFDPDINRPKEGDKKKEMLRYNERAKVTASIELVNIRTGRSLAKKSFKSISNDGRIIYNLEMKTLDYSKEIFKSSSIGKALWRLNNSIKSFIVQILKDVPLEGDLIIVDQNNKSAMINLGKANGIMVQDVFTIFSITTSFSDPLNQTDLGDKYTRKGVIKIVEVQGRFSRAQIIAGLDLAPGDLVVPKIRKSTKYKTEDRTPKKDIIWGSYKGLPSLSY